MTLDPESFVIRSIPCPDCDGRIVYNAARPKPKMCSDCRNPETRPANVTDWQ